jgi:hypothetical protein
VNALAFDVLCMAVTTVCLVALINDRHMLLPQHRARVLVPVFAIWLASVTVTAVWVLQ